MPSFIGTWNTKRHRSNDLLRVDDIQIAITDDVEPGHLDGSYPMPGPNARMFGPVEPAGTTWSATFDEGPSANTGQVMFVLSDDGNMIHGAWIGSEVGQAGTNPWFGVRAV